MNRIDNYVIVKVSRPTLKELEKFDEAMGTERFDTGRVHGLKATGKPFKGELTVAVCGNAYALDLIVRALRAGCVPYSLDIGKPVAKRKKKCTTSTQSELILVGLMSECQTDLAQDCKNITRENAEQPEEKNGE